MSNTIKRFIAGAVCPKCNQMDKTVVFSIGEKNYSECVRCGFKQEAMDQKAPKTQKTSSAAKKVIWLKKSDKKS